MASDREERQDIVKGWIIDTWGSNAFYSPKERVNRILEEAIELAQAEGLSESVIYKTVEHVLARPKGEPFQELGGIAIGLLAYAESKNWSLSKVELREIIRAVNLPVEKLANSHTRKALVGLAPSHPDNIDLPSVEIKWINNDEH